jgi:hypothetical protein
MDVSHFGADIQLLNQLIESGTGYRFPNRGGHQKVTADDLKSLTATGTFLSLQAVSG